MGQTLRIKNTLPLIVKEIRFNDGTTMKDRTIMLCDGFLAVEGEAGVPSLYNMNGVAALIEVQNIQDETRPARFVWF